MIQVLIGAIAVFLLLQCSSAAYLPVVVMHGITQDATGMDHVVQWIQEALPGTYVKNVEIGNGVWDSVFMNMNDQVADFCRQVDADPQLKQGFNLIGYSQGTLVTRGFIERCSQGYGVYNYISWDGPQMGQFGVPFVNIPWVDNVVAQIPYDPWIQKTISFAGYWKDPNKYSEYLEKSVFLADINNERAAKNETYKTNIISLNAMVVLDSRVDVVIVPVQSCWFGFYQLNDTKQTIPLEQEPFYTEDWIGLRTLEEAGRLHKYTTDCPHGDYPNEVCRHWFTSYTLPYLNVTVGQAKQERVPRVQVQKRVGARQVTPIKK